MGTDAVATRGPGVDKKKNKDRIDYCMAHAAEVSSVVWSTLRRVPRGGAFCQPCGRWWFGPWVISAWMTYGARCANAPLGIDAVGPTAFRRESLVRCLNRQRRIALCSAPRSWSGQERHHDTDALTRPWKRAGLRLVLTTAVRTRRDVLCQPTTRFLGSLVPDPRHRVAIIRLRS